VSEDSIVIPSGKQSRSISGSDRANGCGSDWVSDVFAENNSGTEGDGSRSSKRFRSSSRPLGAAKNRPLVAAAVKGVQVSSNAQGDQASRDGQGCKIYQIVGESGSEYEGTALTTTWLPQASVDPKLARKYPGRAEGGHPGPNAPVIRTANSEMNATVQQVVQIS
jgi:hypothetical protein